MKKMLPQKRSLRVSMYNTGDVYKHINKKIYSKYALLLNCVIYMLCPIC